MKWYFYTILTVITVDLLATSGDITMTWSSPMLVKLHSNDSNVNPFGEPITDLEDSWIGSLINVGAMIGPFPYGILAARFGRKITLLCIAVPHIISYLTFAFSNSIYGYYFARTFGGIAVGGGYTVLPMYVAEVAEDSNRGMLSVTLNIFWTFGNSLSYIIGPYLSARWFNIILACVPTTFFILFLLIAPESPYYLVTKNRLKEAENSLMKLRSGDKKAVEAELVKMQKMVESEPETVSIKEFAQSKTCRIGILICIVLITTQMLSGINAVMFYTEEIFSAAGASSIKPEIASIIVGLVCFTSSFFAPFMADRMGRRFLLLISCGGTTIALIGLGAFFYLKSENYDTSSVSWFPIVVTFLFCFFFNVGWGPLPWTLCSELFATNAKPIAASLTSFFCWFTSFFVTKFFSDLNHALGQGGTFWLFSGFCFCTFLFVWFYVPETKNKSFQEIQEILEQK